MVKQKSVRDPGAPKRNVSAYLMYQNAMRDTLKELNPGMSFGQLAKYTSAMYAEMPPEEKEGWEARAEADKQRFMNEMASYHPPPGFDANGDAVEPSTGDAVHASPSDGARRGKTEKDENAPKRNVSAYIMYQNAMRDQFKRENPGMTFGQLSKYTSHMYKNLTEEEKAVWESRAAEDKARYESEIAHYNPPPGYDTRGKPRGKPIEEQRPKGRKNKKASKDPNAPKRVSGPYVFFTQDIRQQINSEFPGINFVESGRIMGERWRNLSPQEKKRYEDMAAEDKVRFEREMEEYNGRKRLADQKAGVPLPQRAAVAATTADHSYQQHAEPHAAYPHQQATTYDSTVHPQY